jgi:membrane protein DedA with SNARE-associated domain
MDAIEPFLGWLARHTYVIVFLGTVVDATGIPFPGRLLLVVAGSLAARADVSLTLVVLLGAAGAVLGDHLWYLAGRANAERMLRLYCRVTLGSGRCTAATSSAFERYGGLAIVIGRFVAGVRIFAWPLAGASGIGYARFLVLDALGALAWSSVFVLPGYLLGDRWIPFMAEHLGSATLALALLGLAALAGVLAHRLWRRSRFGSARLADLWAKTGFARAA